MATAALLQHASSALPHTRDRDRSTSRPGRTGRPAHRNIQIQPTLRTINEIIQALRERPRTDLDRAQSVAAVEPLLYLPPILSLLPPCLTDGSSPSVSSTVHYTDSRLSSIDPVTLAFHRALHAFRPLTPLYAVVPYAEAFNWSEILLEEDKEGTRKIIMYWFGAPFPSTSEGDGAPIEDDLVGVNLATCIWNSRSDAIEAMRGEKHREAARLASTTYETYQLERYIIRKERGELSIAIRDWHGGEVVGAS